MVADGHIDEVLCFNVKVEIDHRACRNAGLSRKPCGEEYALCGKGVGGHDDAEANAVFAGFNLGIENGKAALRGNAAQYLAALNVFKRERSIIENEPEAQSVRLVIAAYPNGNVNGAAGSNHNVRHAENGACALRLQRGGGNGKQHQYCGGNECRSDSFHGELPFFFE